MSGAPLVRACMAMLLTLALVICVAPGALHAEQRTPESELIFAARGAERLLGRHGTDLSREQIRAARIRLEAAMARVIEGNPRYRTRLEGRYAIAHVYQLLGALDVLEGQPGAAERRFADGEAAAIGAGANAAAVGEFARARATALALDGRFDAASAQLAKAPPCSAQSRCAMSRLGETCREVGPIGITMGWDMLRLGPRGLCVATLFLQSARVAAAQARPDLVEPFLKLPIFAARNLRFVDPGAAGWVRFEATLDLVSWYRLHGRESDAAALVAEARSDPELVAAGGSLFADLMAQFDPRRTARPSPAMPRDQDAELAASIAANERALGSIGPAISSTPWLRSGLYADADSFRAASEILRSLALQYAQKGDLTKALEHNLQALYFVPGFVEPSLPVRLDLGPRLPACPPARRAEPQCRAWDTNALAQYANLYLAELLSERAILEAQAGHNGEALIVDRLGQAVLQNWISRNWIAAGEVRRALERRASVDARRLTALAPIAARGGAQGDAATAQAFLAVQLIQFNRVEAAVRAAIARGSVTSPIEREVLQQRQRLQDERLRLSNDRARSEALAAQIAQLESKLSFSASEFDRRIIFTPLALDQARAALGNDEALLVLAQLDDRIEAIAVTRDGAAWRSVAAPADWVGERVARLRRHLDAPRVGRIVFDRQAAFELYQRIIAPLSETLGRKLIFVSANGALAELPLGLLVAASPAGGDGDAVALRATSWLFERNALVTLPSAAALDAVARRAAANRRNALIGFGAPPGSALMDEEVRNTDAALRFASGELEALARAQQGPTHLFLGPDATEAAVRRARLDSTRILAFATHAVGPGNGRAEPGLILAPPVGGSSGPQDDGFLSASEVALLPLGADVVVLSACSTASADQQGGEALSGLALSFLYAGGQSVLATHWPVADEAAARLVTGTLGAATVSRPQDIARALQREMGELMRAPADSRFADPRIWAPFVVVGG
jgi:CHAT domain-containing protein